MTCDHILCQLEARCVHAPDPLLVLDGTHDDQRILERMSHDDMVEVRDRNRAALCRSSLYDFLRYSWATVEPGTLFEDAWYIRVICDHVQRQLEDWAAAMADRAFVQPIINLVINIPPRCLKSRIVNEIASAWAVSRTRRRPSSGSMCSLRFK